MSDKDDPSHLTLLLLAFTSVLAVYLSSLLWRRRCENMKDRKCPLPLPPGSMGWPIVGENIQFARKGAQFFVERVAKYGKIYKTHILGGPIVRVSGAEYIAPLVNKEPGLLTMKVPTSSRQMFGNSSITNITGEEHSRLKKTLLTTLTPVRLDDYLPCVQEKIQEHIIKWCQEGRVLGFPACEELMGDVIMEVTLGWRKENDPDGEIRKAFVKVNKNLISVPIRIPGGGYNQAVKARKTITDFVRQRLHSQGDKDHVCVLDVFLAGRGHGSGEEGAGLTEEQVIDNAVTFLIAGSGTTAGALGCLLLVLGKHPDVLEKLRQELDAKGLLSPDMSTHLTYDLLQSLEYTQWVIKEVLRLHPPVGGVFRQAKKTLEVGNWQVPQGWTVMYSIRDTHFTTNVFERRDEFLPERWKDKNLLEMLRKAETCNYIPFGIGPRSCLGKNLALAEMAVFLIEVARLANWKLLNPESKMVYLPVTKCADDMPLTFSRRK
ncbi:cytochrome P450 26A1-like [Physella acuta]|uniref:cytochrome P450 26A1-like n=1 Tax=Physella acuta TaxID=109671 RepID=UPI0027DBC611|nr:cytochrome P450 26A1-like [Physella acuta]